MIQNVPTDSFLDAASTIATPGSSTVKHLDDDAAVGLAAAAEGGATMSTTTTAQ